MSVLDTSTLVLLGEIEDTATLPDEPFISVVTLAELSVGPLVATSDADRVAAMPTFSRQRRTPIRLCSALQQRVGSGTWRHRLGGLVARRRHRPL